MRQAVSMMAAPSTPCWLRNALWIVASVTLLNIYVFRPGSSTLLFLPLAHVFGRAIQLGCARWHVQ